MSQLEQDTHSSVAEGKAPKNTTLTQNIIIGSVAGASEVAINHPLWSIKTRVQRGEPFTFNIFHWYRGILPNAASMIPITGMQVGLNKWVQTVFFTNPTSLSDSQKLSCAFVAGLGSSFVSCPTEMIMTYQGVKGGRFYATGKEMVKNRGWRCLWTGLPATSIREGLFSAAFLAGMPMLKSNIHSYFTHDSTATLAAGIGAGIVATFVTQGFDTLKTKQQASYPSPAPGLINAAQSMYANIGIHGFFKGAIPRGTRVVSAITIMGYAKEKMEAKLR